MTTLKLDSLPKNYEAGNDAYAYYRDVSLEDLVDTIKEVLALSKGQGHKFGFIEVPLLRAYERKVYQERKEKFDKELIAECCEIFQLEQIQFVYETLLDSDKIHELINAMDKKRGHLWEALPKNYQPKKEINKFYSKIPINKLVEFMQAVIAEWNMDYSDPIKYGAVSSVEKPLITAFRDIAQAKDIQKYEKVLKEFQICDDMSAVNIARELLGKKVLEF